MIKIALFDLDGVLVQPGGYRAAVRDVLKYFTTLMNVSCQQLPGEEEMAAYESLTITDEWDMVPLSLAILFEYICQSVNAFPELKNLEEAITWTQPQNIKLDFTDYLSKILSMRFWVKPGFEPSEQILMAVRLGAAAGLFPHIEKGGLLDDLLGHTQSVRLSRVTRVFQEFVLGSDQFQRIYRLLPEMNVPSYLEKYDTALLNEDLRKQLVAGKDLGFYAVIYTARFSLPPKEIDQDLPDYFPAAEMAAALNSIGSLPLMGYGRIEYLANQLAVPAARLLKPAPVQALAAAAAAWSGLEWPSLAWAASLWDESSSILLKETGKLPDLPEVFELIVFEDSPNGVIAGLSAVDLLTKAGYKVSGTYYGIGQNKSKINALQQLGAEIFPDINSALDHCLNFRTSPAS